MLPTTTSAATGEMVTETGPVMVTKAVLDFEGSAEEVAVTVICGGFGGTDGAVYRPVPEIVPQVAPLQP